MRQEQNYQYKPDEPEELILRFDGNEALADQVYEWIREGFHGTRFTLNWKPNDRHQGIFGIMKVLAKKEGQ